MRLSLAVIGLLICILIGSAQATIRATTILFRHGERTPAYKVAAMPSALAEDIGYGQLTQFGSWQHYENGLFLRARYLHLFPKDGYFRLNNMQIMSSLYDRAIMSLQSFMSGFFPPPLLDMNLPVFWQPFSFTMDHEAKFLHFDFGGNTCPKYDKLVTDAMVNPPAHVVALLESEREALDDISLNLGSPLNTVMEIGSLYDTIGVLIRLGENVPSWAVEAQTTLSKFNFNFLVDTEFKIQVRGGGVIKQVVQNMEAVINNAAEGKKFMIYSGHDLNVLALSLILGVESQIPQPMPNLADTILIDLVDNGGSEMQVQSIYVDNSGSIPKRFVLDVPGCGKICNFSTFKGVVAKYFISDWNALCAL